MQKQDLEWRAGSAGQRRLSELAQEALPEAIPWGKKEVRERNLLGLDPEPSGNNSRPSNYLCPHWLPCAPPNWWNPMPQIPGARISKDSLVRMFRPDQGIFQVVLGIGPLGSILLGGEGSEMPQCHWKYSLSCISYSTSPSWVSSAGCGS